MKTRGAERANGPMASILRQRCWTRMLCAVALTLAAGCSDRATPGGSDGGADAVSSVDGGLDGPLADGSHQRSDTAGSGPDGDRMDSGPADSRPADRGPATDLGLLPDAPTGDLAPPPDTGPLGDSGVVKRGYVVSKLLLPRDAVEARAYGVDFDNNGTIDNALGSILSALSSVSSGLDVQAGVDGAVRSGRLLQLLRVTAPSLTTAASATLESWIGQDQNCAALACFSGSHTFKPDPRYPKPSLLRGAIAAGRTSAGPAPLKIELALATTATVVLDLKAGRISGQLSGTTILDGKIAGAIAQTDVNNKIIPAIAVLLTQTVKDPNTSASTRAQILNLFDTNSDGVITAAELQANALIKTFLAGDVDVDNDGVNELSLGFGFRAVSARINAP